MTIAGSGYAKRSRRSTVDPGADAVEKLADQRSTRGRRLSTTPGVNCLTSRRRSRVWTGGSVVETIAVE